MDLIAPMLHEHKEVSEIVGVLDGIVQVRFEHTRVRQGRRESRLQRPCVRTLFDEAER